MLLNEVADLFASLIDEDDATFLSDAQRSVLLGRGDARFRDLVTSYIPDFYATRVTISPTTDSYDLATAAVIILGGGTLTGPRLHSLIKVEDIDGSGDHLDYWLAAASWAELRDRANTYFLNGTVLYFHDDPSNDIRLTYVPVSSVNWTNLASAAFIDDLSNFHDIIAVMAARFYSVRDVGTNAELDRLLAERKLELELYLTQGRVRGAGDHVGRVRRR